jgi:hypothetical protein
MYASKNFGTVSSMGRSRAANARLGFERTDTGFACVKLS